VEKPVNLMVSIVDGQRTTKRSHGTMVEIAHNPADKGSRPMAKKQFDSGCFPESTVIKLS
jgi:hypothetical protein